jgi:hypothetical protein
MCVCVCVWGRQEKEGGGVCLYVEATPGRSTYNDPQEAHSRPRPQGCTSRLSQQSQGGACTLAWCLEEGVWEKEGVIFDEGACGILDAVTFPS